MVEERLRYRLARAEARVQANELLLEQKKLVAEHERSVRFQIAEDTRIIRDLVRQLQPFTEARA